MSGTKEALRSEIAALREELAEVRQELAVQRAQDARHCRGCHCQAIWVYPYTSLPATPAWGVSPVICGSANTAGYVPAGPNTAATPSYATTIAVTSGVN